MITGKIVNIGFLGNEQLNKSPLCYPGKNPEIIFRLDDFLRIYNKDGRYIYSAIPKITMFSCLRELKKGKELQETIKGEFGIKFKKKELKDLLYTISTVYLSRTGKVHLKALDMEIELNENEYFLDAGCVRSSILKPRGRCFDYDIDVLHFKQGEEISKKNYKFVSLFYRKYKSEQENLLIRAHEEAHALDKLGKFDLLEEEISRYESTEGIEELDAEGRAFLGTGLVAKKRGFRNAGDFSIIEFAKKLSSDKQSNQPSNNASAR